MGASVGALVCGWVAAWAAGRVGECVGGNRDGVTNTRPFVTHCSRHLRSGREAGISENTLRHNYNSVCDAWFGARTMRHRQSCNCDVTCSRKKPASRLERMCREQCVTNWRLIVTPSRLPAKAPFGFGGGWVGGRVGGWVRRWVRWCVHGWLRGRPGWWASVWVAAAMVSQLAAKL